MEITMERERVSVYVMQMAPHATCSISSVSNLCTENVVQADHEEPFGVTTKFTLAEGCFTRTVPFDQTSVRAMQ